eukprot:gene25857-29211_t
MAWRSCAGSRAASCGGASSPSSPRSSHSIWRHMCVIGTSLAPPSKGFSVLSPTWSSATYIHATSTLNGTASQAMCPASAPPTASLSLSNSLTTPSGYGAGGEFHYASDLVSFIRTETGDDFHIEVAAYPEIHPQAKSPEADLQAFATKVKAGANSAITQYFYNSDAYFRFVDDAYKLGVDVPVVPGIMPITSSSQLLRFSDACGAEIPRWIRLRLQGYGDDIESIKAFGLDVVSDLCEQLINGGLRVAQQAGAQVAAFQQVVAEDAVVYQDVFYEGSFIGKGIYDVDVFERVLGARLPDNRILSHDLLEGCYVRAGLLSDVQLYDSYPERYIAARCIAVLQSTPEAAWPYFQQAWDVAHKDYTTDPAYKRISLNLVTEISFLLQQELWYDKMEAFMILVTTGNYLQGQNSDAFTTMSIKVKLYLKQNVEA